MRRKIAIPLVVLCLLIFSGSQASAFWWQKEEAGKPSVTEQTKEPARQQKEVPMAPQSQDRDAMRALKQEKREQLNNTEWEIEMVLLGGKKKGKSEKDTLTFENNQISSGSFGRRGFMPTNYTITIQGNGTLVWETMQSSQKGSVAFWRGEIDMANMQKMQGIISYHVDKKTTQDYAFQSISKRAILPSSTNE